ncbi:MAG: hypothetical protein GXZ05_09550 [Gammaproteobacteria bacterium]|nr:hypothetical protein [Gammaproteobacteria bacterium]
MKVISEKLVKMPRLMEVSAYRAARFEGRKPSVQQLKKWIDQGIIVGEVKDGMYFVDLSAELLGSDDPLLSEMLKVG